LINDTESGSKKTFIISVVSGASPRETEAAGDCFRATHHTTNRVSIATIIAEILFDPMVISGQVGLIYIIGEASPTRIIFNRSNKI
jgi:hypothetical protein